MNADIGRKLRQAREEQGITIEQAASETFIRPHYLQALEEGQFDQLPSPVQLRGFLRNYAAYLHLEPTTLFAGLEGAPQNAPANPVAETAVEEPPAPTPPAEIIDLGEALRTRRETLGLSLDEVARHTHIRDHYLQALENGDLSALPSTVQGSGMLKNYASFLGLDPEPLLRYAEVLQANLQARRGRPASAAPQPAGEGPIPRSGIRRLLSREVFLSVSLIFFLMTLVIWGGTQIIGARSAQKPEPSPPSIADVLLPSPTATIAPTATATIPSPLDVAAEAAVGAAPPVATAEAVLTDSPIGAVQIQIVIRQRAYLRVLVDGELEFEGRVIPGAAYAFAGDESVEILTGNAAALEVNYNGQNLGLMGGFGEVVNTVYTVAGAQTPTPTTTPTPTRTPRRSPTPSPTP